MNYTQIQNYATKYYLRYYPSKNRLIEKVKEKFHPSDSVLQTLLDDMREIIVEEEVIKAKIGHYIERWKNISYIKLKLIQKNFDKELVFKYIWNIEENGTILDYDKTIQKVSDYLTKGKSKNYVRNKLIERPDDKEVVESAIVEVYPNNQSIIIGQLYNKLQPKFNLKERSSRDKFSQKMITAGFPWGDIKEFLREMEE